MFTHPLLNPFDWLCYKLVYALAFVQSFILIKVVQAPVWRTGDGRVMLIREMTDSHLNNAIRYVERGPEFSCFDGPDGRGLTLRELRTINPAWYQLTTERQRRENARRFA